MRALSFAARRELAPRWPFRASLPSPRPPRHVMKLARCAPGRFDARGRRGKGFPPPSLGRSGAFHREQRCADDRGWVVGLGRRNRGEEGVFAGRSADRQCRLVRDHLGSR